MPQTHVSIVQGRGIAVIHGDFTRRSHIVSLAPRPESDDVVIARASALEKKGKKAEAEAYLDQHLRRQN